jgi:hypothetical protein
MKFEAGFTGISWVVSLLVFLFDAFD